MRTIILAILLVLGAPLYAKPNVDLADISCIEAATGGPRGEYTGEQITMIALSVENYWRQEFARLGLPFRDVGIKIFSGRVQTGCGVANADSGPFYCRGDRFIYIDPGFFYTDGSLRILGRPTRALITYVIAHEFGHHIQVLLEVMERVERVGYLGGGLWGTRMSRRIGTPQVDYGPPMEYQADCLAGVYLKQLYARELTSEEEVMENVRRMSRLGDDYIHQDMLRRQFGWPIRLGLREGYSHGTSQYRQAWMARGFTSGDMKVCEPFSFPTLN